MYSQDHLPVHANYHDRHANYDDRHANYDDRRYRRQHTRHHYVQRVKESLTTRASKVICGVFLTLLLIAGVVVFITWLSLRPHRPRFHVHNFSIPGLAQQNGFENAQVIFNVTDRNPARHVGIYYDAMQVTLYYQDQSIGRTSLLSPFYQEPKNTTVLYGVLSGATLTVTNGRWTEFQNDKAQGVVVFRLELTSTIRFKVTTFAWHSKRHKMYANCVLGVGPDGSILPIYSEKRCPVYFS